MNTKEKLMHLLELCIEKGLSFDFTPNTLLSISKFDKQTNNSWLFYQKAWGELTKEKIDELIEVVKYYQP